MQTLTNPLHVVEHFKANHTFNAVGRTYQAERVQVSDTKALSFSASHDKDRRCFHSTLTVWDLEDGTWYVTLHTGFHRIGYKPVARYSPKALEAFWADTVDSFELANETAKLVAA